MNKNYLNIYRNIATNSDDPVARKRAQIILANAAVRGRWEKIIQTGGDWNPGIKAVKNWRGDEFTPNFKAQDLCRGKTWQEKVSGTLKSLMV